MSSSQQTMMCGYCNKSLDEKYLIPPNFKKTCVLCQDNKILHQTCALRFYNNSQFLDKKSKATRISTQDFQSYNKDFFCAACQQLECLVCRKKHPHSEYYIFVILILPLLLKALSNKIHYVMLQTILLQLKLVLNATLFGPM